MCFLSSPGNQGASLAVATAFAFLLLPAAAAQAQTTFTVDTLSDAAHDSNCGNGCTLREAVALSAAGDTIEFSVGGTINLSAALFFDNGVHVDGTTAPSQIVLSTGGAARVVGVDTGDVANPVVLRGLSLTGGAVSGTFDGAAIFVNNSALEVIGCTLTGNTATGAGSMGGAVSITDSLGSVDVIIEQSTISGNSTGDSGGGIYIESTGNTAILSVWNSTVIGNSAANGGGIYNDGATVEISGSTISGNTSTGPGAASVESVDNVDSTHSLAAENSIIANDTAGVSCSPGPGTQTNNIDSGTSCGWSNVSGSLGSTDPLLGPLGNYGGLTQTLPLLPGSPAIDAGNTGGGAAGACDPGLQEDQRGSALIGNCDIGSFESQGFTLGINSGDGQSTPVGTAFPLPLVVDVTSDAVGTPEPVDGGIVEFRGPLGGAGTAFGGFTTQPISGGLASLSATANTVAGGPYNVTADTAGNSGLAVTFSLTNTSAVTTTTIVSDTPDPSYSGETVTVDVTVTGLTPSGTVDITGADVNCTAPLTGGAGSCDVTFTAPGSRTLTATYGGDGTNLGSADTEAHEVFFPPGDSDHDGNADIFWRDPQRPITLVSYFIGTNYSGKFKMLQFPVPPPWEMAAAADFNLDGSPDILWRNPVSGINVIAHYQDNLLLNFKLLPGQGPEWRVFGTGDSNKDRYPDIFWYNAQTRANEVWYMQDKTLLAKVDLPPAPAPWVPVAVADFDGDTNPDAVALNSVSGRAVIALLSATNLKAVTKLAVASTGWEACGTIDMNGDNMPDLVWRDPMTGADEAWIIENSVRTSTVALPVVMPGWNCMAGHK